MSTVSKSDVDDCKALVKSHRADAGNDDTTVNEQAPLTAAAEAATREDRRGRQLSLVALALTGTAGISVMVGAMTPIATRPTATGFVDAYLFQFVTTISDAPTDTTNTDYYTPKLCFYPLASAALACACVGGVASGLLACVLLWRLYIIRPPAAPSHTPWLLVWLLGIGTVGSSAAAVVSAAAFFYTVCSGHSLQSTGYTLTFGFGFLAVSCAASLFALIFTAVSLRYQLFFTPPGRIPEYQAV